MRFRMGARKVVRGFEEGVSRLALGSHARIHVPAALGYGATEARARARARALRFLWREVGAPRRSTHGHSRALTHLPQIPRTIPSNSDLIFDVELVKIDGASASSSAGEPIARPKPEGRRRWPPPWLSTLMVHGLPPPPPEHLSACRLLARARARADGRVDAAVPRAGARAPRALRRVAFADLDDQCWDGSPRPFGACVATDFQTGWRAAQEWTWQYLRQRYLVRLRARSVSRRRSAAALKIVRAARRS